MYWRAGHQQEDQPAPTLQGAVPPGIRVIMPVFVGEGGGGEAVGLAALVAVAYTARGSHQSFAGSQAWTKLDSFAGTICSYVPHVRPLSLSHYAVDIINLFVIFVQSSIDHLPIIVVESTGLDLPPDYPGIHGARRRLHEGGWNGGGVHLRGQVCRRKFRPVSQPSVFFFVSSCCTVWAQIGHGPCPCYGGLVFVLLGHAACMLSAASC